MRSTGDMKYQFGYYWRGTIGKMACFMSQSRRTFSVSPIAECSNMCSFAKRLERLTSGVTVVSVDVLHLAQCVRCRRAQGHAAHRA